MCLFVNFKRRVENSCDRPSVPHNNFNNYIDKMFERTQWSSVVHVFEYKLLYRTSH